jgi:hypothetical protein
MDEQTTEEGCDCGGGIPGPIAAVVVVIALGAGFMLNSLILGNHHPTDYEVDQLKAELESRDSFERGRVEHEKLEALKASWEHAAAVTGSGVYDPKTGKFIMLPVGDKNQAEIWCERFGEKK